MTQSYKIKSIGIGLITTFMLLLVSNILMAQNWHVGDLYEFPDGSKGIVCHVDSKNPQRGWVIALNDLPVKYDILKSGTTKLPEGLKKSSFKDYSTPTGKHNTRILREAESPAAMAVDFENGWYIPDAVQLAKIFALAISIEKDVYEAGGSISHLKTTSSSNYWSSTPIYEFETVIMSGVLLGGYFYPRSVSETYPWNPTNAAGFQNYIRPVRDFGYDAEAYWVDNHGYDTMKVGPVATTAYNAVVAYGPDTFRLTSSAIVHQPSDKDTIREIACVSTDPYTSQKYPTFANIDVSTVKDWQSFRDTLQTVNGCDSIVTLMLKVIDNCEEVLHYDTICEITDSWYFEPFDTTFLPGTVSDVYEHTVMVSGLPVTHYLDLTVVKNDASVEVTITCATDVEKQIAFGECNFKVEETTLDEATATHSLGWALEINAQLPADSMLAAGENTVMWIATDRCGNADTCTQKVTVTFPDCPTVTDADGNTYESVRIGCDCWMQRNLESSTYADNSPISWAKGYESFMHPDADANIAVFGRLYDFASAVKDSADNGHGHVQGACPDGWHLPTPAQYSALLGMDATTLKTSEYWIDGGGNNSTGFAWLPAGRYNGAATRFEGLLASSWFWSVEGTGENLKVYSFCTRYSCDTVMEDSPANGSAYSIRCVKEKE